MSRSIPRPVFVAVLLTLLSTRGALGQCIDYQDGEGAIDTPGSAYGVAVSGSYAYVADYNSGLQIVDVTQPGLLQIIGNVDTPGSALDVCLSGSHAYVADGNPGIQVVDVSDPTAPAIVGGLDTPVYAKKVAMYGAYLCVMDYNQLQVIDVSDPTAPALFGSVTIQTDAEGLAVSGSYAYIAGLVGLQIVDLSTPSAPVVVGSVSGDLLSVGISGSYAYVGQATDEMLVMDVSNPTAPYQAGYYNDSPPIGGGSIALAVSGSLVYVNDGSKIFYIDISTPTSPSYVGTRTASGSVRGLAVSGTKLYAAATNAGLLVAYASGPAVVSQYSNGCCYRAARDVDVHGSWAYFANGSYGLQYGDISDPTAFIIWWEVDTPGDARGVAVDYPLAYVADYGSGLRILDIHSIYGTSVGAVDTPGQAWKVQVSGSYAYVADGDSGVEVVDVSTPASPAIVGAVDTPGEARNLTISGSLVYVADYDAGLQVLNISNPLSPALLGGVDTPGFAQAVLLSGIYAYVCDDTSGLQVVDVTYPSMPVIVGHLDTPGPALGGSISGTIAYIACSQDGIIAVDISDPVSPVLLGGVDTPGTATDAVESGSYVCVADGSYGWEVIRGNCQQASTGIENPAPPAPGLPAHLLPGFPNPFRVSTALTLDLPTRSIVNLTVLDVRGRQVRSLLRNRLLPAGKYETSWDGTDDAGTHAAAGIYFIRLSRRGENEMQPVTLLR